MPVMPISPVTVAAVRQALEESAALESDCRRRVEALQTVTAEREQQLMDDAENRLREVRRECKRKLEEQKGASEVGVRRSDKKIGGHIYYFPDISRNLP